MQIKEEKKVGVASSLWWRGGGRRIKVIVKMQKTKVGGVRVGGVVRVDVNEELKLL